MGWATMGRGTPSPGRRRWRPRTAAPAPASPQTPPVPPHSPRRAPGARPDARTILARARAAWQAGLATRDPAPRGAPQALGTSAVPHHPVRRTAAVTPGETPRPLG